MRKLKKIPAFGYLADEPLRQILIPIASPTPSTDNIAFMVPFHPVLVGSVCGVTDLKVGYAM